MQRNGEMCFLGSPESAEMKKLEELVNVMFCHLLQLKSANSLISALSADELPQAFRLTFKLLDQTGRNICLSRAIYQQQCVTGKLDGFC